MSAIGSWLERVYTETDVARGLATSVSGIVGLIVYLVVEDWVVAALSLVIVFPVARVTTGWLHARANRRIERRLKEEEARELLEGLSEAERAVVAAFVDAGGTVLTWSQTNRLGLGGSAFESLMSRGLIRTSITADAMRETFVLDAEIFNIARRVGAPVGGRVDRSTDSSEGQG